MNQIDPELLKRLDALTDKLGVGAHQAWQIFIRQAHIEALSWVPWLILWIVAIFVFVWGSKKLDVKAAESSEPDGWRVAQALMYAGVLLGACICMNCIVNVFLIELNPQAYALKEILWRLK